jgi:hypothetical protein
MDPNRRSTYSTYPSSRRRRRRVTRRRLAFAVSAVAVVGAVVAVAVFLYGGKSSGSPTTTGQGTSISTRSSQPGTTGGRRTTVADSGSAGSSTTTLTSRVNMTVAPVNGTRPSDFQMVTKIFRGSTQILAYTRTSPIDLGPGQDYTSLPGILTFRGNNYRDDPTYGTANVTQATLQILWSVPTGSIKKSAGGYWTGSGWTGQPLIVQWPDDLKQIMNLSPSAKAQPDLKEIIYPCEDGNIYFLNLKDGSKTRPTIVTGGGALKGTGSIDPNGIPILFDGQGDNSPGKQVMRCRLYSLIDQHLLYTFGTQPDPNSYRRWNAFDSSALYDAADDTLIEPGENGILYTVKLNTTFDKAAGTLTVSPDPPIKANYTDPNYKDESISGKADPTDRWYGMEDSAVIWHNYCYVADNGGSLMCWDLDTMKLVWVQNCQDDTNTSPVFEEDPQAGTCYIYLSTSLHETETGTGYARKGAVPVWKINAATGQIVWETQPYPCYSISGVDGGVQDSPVLGKNDISNLVIYAIARTPTPSSGIMVALDKSTGKEVWRTSFKNYMWSSPVAVYTPQGKSYIVACDSAGNMFLIEGTTGKILDTISLGANIEASPSVFGNTIVVGTRGQKIYAVQIS